MNNKGCHNCRYYLQNSSDCLQETMQRGHLMRNGLIGNCQLFIDEKETPETFVDQQPQQGE